MMSLGSSLFVAKGFNYRTEDMHVVCAVIAQDCYGLAKIATEFLSDGYGPCLHSALLSRE